MGVVAVAPAGIPLAVESMVWKEGSGDTYLVVVARVCSSEVMYKVRFPGEADPSLGERE